MTVDEYNDLLREAERLVSAGIDDHHLLAFLRDRGASKVHSIRIVRMVRGLDLRTADDLVHYSDVWADRRQSDEAILDAFLDSVGEKINIEDLE